MPKVAIGSDSVANELLKLFHLRKSLLLGTRPKHIGTDANLEDASCAWL